MEKNELKELLKSVLHEFGNLVMRVSPEGNVQIILFIDNEEVLATESLDLIEDISFAKSAYEAHSWC